MGQSLYQQVVPIEFDAQGNLIAQTSSKRLRATIGSF